jgi:hypothetical protein
VKKILVGKQNIGLLIGAIVAIFIFIITEHFFFRFLQWWRVFFISVLMVWLILYASEKFLYYIGAVLAILGSFLPWWCAGDIIVFCASGIDFYGTNFIVASLHHIGYFNSPFSLNNVGIIVVLFSLFTVWLVTYPPKFIKHPRVWTFASSTVLVLFTIYQFADHLSKRIESLHITSGLWLEYGFLMVLYGSLLLLTPALRDNKLHNMSNIFMWSLVVFTMLVPFSFLLESFVYTFLNYD